MKLSTALTKLEREVKELTLCAWCQYASPYASFITEPKNSLDYLFVRCVWCGAATNYTLKGRDEYEKEALRLFEGKRSGECYRDVRVFAALEWYYCWQHVKRWAVDDEEELKKAVHEFTAKKRKEAEQANAPKEKLKGKALKRAETEEKAMAFFRQMLEEEKKRHSPYTFNLPDEIEKLRTEITSVKDEYVEGQWVKPLDVEYWFRWELYLCQVAELCEKVLWKKLRPETKDALNFLTQFVAKLEQKRLERINELVELGAKRKAEREEAEAKRKAEREAEEEKHRQEREARSNPTPFYERTRQW